MATVIRRTPVLSGEAADNFLEAMENPKTKATKDSIRKSFAKAKAIIKKSKV